MECFLLLVFLFRAAPGIYLKAGDNKGRGEKQEVRASYPVIRFIGFSRFCPVIIPVTCHIQDTGRESFYRKIGFPSFPPLLLGNFILKYKLTQKGDPSLSPVWQGTKNPSPSPTEVMMTSPSSSSPASHVGKKTIHVEDNASHQPVKFHMLQDCM